jgi:DNA repair protein RecO (recombination protein O)
MQDSDQGILLRTHPFSETSLVVRWLTQEHGRIATLARGATRPKSPLRGRLDLYFIATITYTPSRQGTLHTLKEITLDNTFASLRQSYPALAQAAYATRLIERVTETDTPLPGLFQILQQFLQTTSRRPTHSLHVAALELQLLQWLGQAPNLDISPISSGARSLCQRLLEPNPDLHHHLQPTDDQSREIQRFLTNELQNQLDIPPNWRPRS